MKEILFYTNTDIEHGKRRNGKPIIHKHEHSLRIIGGDFTEILVKDSGKGNYTPFLIKPQALYVKDIDGRLINAVGISAATAVLLATKR